MAHEKSGLLSAKSVRLPYDTPEEQAEADKMNAEIAGTGFSTARIGYDWAFQAYEDLPTNIRNATPNKQIKERIQTPLKSGQLVKIFKTVSDGDVQWSGTIDYTYEKYHHGHQRDLTLPEWSVMFSDGLPAKLERDGEVMFGSLEPFCETGTEGVIWSLHEYNKPGYEGLVCLQKDDKLTVYNRVRDGEIDWEGTLNFGPEEVKKIGWSEILRDTKHMDAEKWLQLTWENRPIIMTPR